MIAGKSICSRIVCALVIASAITISAGDMALKKSVSSSTWLTIIVGFKPADSSKRRRDAEAEARTMRGMNYAFFLAPKVI
ncbi:unannotated protein [freshwater metagenome]|uniref:Unannotated protein n=1 Tax=freshwater metagenome TaxID=449393 RepID=A0A6J6W1U7_9ZZZZ